LAETTSMTDWINALLFAAVGVGALGFVLSMLAIDMLRSSRSGNLLDQNPDPYLSPNVYRMISRAFTGPHPDLSGAQRRMLTLARTSLLIHVGAVILSSIYVAV